jgi:hypothetical protein
MRLYFHHSDFKLNMQPDNRAGKQQATAHQRFRVTSLGKMLDSAQQIRIF